MVRYTIWVLPTLGFVGTVLGVSQALRFAGAANPRDPTLLQELTQILAVKFDTTLVALSLAAVLVLAQHLIERYEEAALNVARPVLHRQSPSIGCSTSDRPCAVRCAASFEFLSMSTLDLFASMLGTFVLVTFVLLPYYLRQPSLEQDIAQAEAETSALAAELRLYREKLTGTQNARSEAERALAAAQQRLASAKALAAAQPAPSDVKKPAPSSLPSPFAIRDLDLVFVIDTTGSMRQEIADMQANLIGVINILNRLSSSLRIGVVAYKDRGEVYLTRDFPLRPMEGAEVGQILDFVRSLEASGGGDDPSRSNSPSRSRSVCPGGPMPRGGSS